MTYDPDRHEMLVISHARALRRVARLEIALALTLAVACILASYQVTEMTRWLIAGGSS